MYILADLQDHGFRFYRNFLTQPFIQIAATREFQDRTLLHIYLGQLMLKTGLRLIPCSTPALHRII